MSDIKASLKLLRSAQSNQLSKLQLKQEADSELLDAINIYFRKRAEIEQQYATSLEKLNKSFSQKRFKRNVAVGLADKPLTVGENGPVTETSTYAAFAIMLSEADKEVQNRSEIATKLQTETSDIGKDFYKHKQVGAKRFLDFGNKYQIDLSTAYDELEKARTAYEKMSKETETSRKKYDDSSNKKKGGFSALRNLVGDSEERVEKLRAKWKNNARKLNDMRNDYILALINVNTIQGTWYQKDLPKLMSDLDGDYYNLFQNLLNNLSAYEQNSIPVIKHSADEVANWSSRIQRDKENTSFINEFSAIFETPLNFDFVPGPSDEINDITVDDVTQVTLGNKLGLIIARTDFLNSEIVQKEKELSGLNQMAQVYSNQPEFGDANSSIDVRQDLETAIGLLKAEYNRLNALSKTLIDLNVAPVKPTLDENGNLQTSLVGFNPIGKNKQIVQLADAGSIAKLSNGGSLSDIAGSTAVYDLGNNGPGSAVATYDYTPVGAGEIAIKNGDALKLAEPEKDGWLTVTNLVTQTKGIVPAKYVSIIIPLDSETKSSINNLAKSSSLSSISPNQVKALYDFKGGDDGELPFTAGDVIEVTDTCDDMTNDAWWEGTCLRTGEKGSFPVVFVQGWQNVTGVQSSGNGAAKKHASPLSAVPVLSNEPTARSGFPVRVVYEYEATCDGELTLIPGEIIRVITTDTGAEAWWEGTGSRGTGQFPKDYTEEVTEAEASIAPPVPSKPPGGSDKSVRALYDYSAATDDELTFQIGDVITDVDDSQEDWWVGTLNGKTGVFPSTYVENA